MMPYPILSTFLAGVLAAATADKTAAGETLDGPIPADVIRVIDGDSLEIRARVWLGIDVTVQVRLRGIDTPEMRGGCDGERALAAAARDYLTALAGTSVTLARIAGDKYAGRVDADVTAADGRNLTTAMLATGLARAYDGGERLDWCVTGATGE